MAKGPLMLAAAISMGLVVLAGCDADSGRLREPAAEDSDRSLTECPLAKHVDPVGRLRLSEASVEHILSIDRELLRETNPGAKRFSVDVLPGTHGVLVELGSEEACPEEPRFHRGVELRYVYRAASTDPG